MILCILKGKMPFKMHKITFFPKCLSECVKLYFFPENMNIFTLLKFSDLLPERHLFFIWPNWKLEIFSLNKLHVHECFSVLHSGV